MRLVILIAAPKVYGFDMGFVCAHRGWTSLRSDDLGHLWEHYVLNGSEVHFLTLDHLAERIAGK